jgi:hypothetical protein
MGRVYYDFLAKCYRDPAIWTAHESELIDLIEHARSRSAGLIVVIFPKLTDVEHTKPFTARVARLFERHGVDVLDLTPVLSGRDPASLIVNRFDGHPNVELNREAAALLLERLRSISAAK